MTEAEWLTSADPAKMLDWLCEPVSLNGQRLRLRKPSDRKLRLVACAIWRLAELGQVNWWNAEALVAAERDAEGLEPPEKLLRFNREISPDFVGEILTRPSAVDALHSLVLFLFPRVGDCRGHADGVQVADAIRCHIINPFRPVTLPVGEECKKCRGKGTVPAGAGGAVVGRPDRVACEACHGTGHGPSPVLTPTVLRLAKAAYEERREDGTLDPELLAVLSDALEDAGLPEVECERCNGHGMLRVEGRGLITRPCPSCTPPGLWVEGTGRQLHPILAHLKSAGPHYRGCWALDPFEPWKEVGRG